MKVAQLWLWIPISINIISWKSCQTPTIIIKKPTNDDKKKQKKSVKNTKPKSCLTKKKEEDYLTNSIFGQTALKKPFLKNSYILNRLDSQC